MKKVVSLLLILVVMLGCLGMAACGSGADAVVIDDGGSHPTDGNGGGNGNGDVNGNGGGESLEDILGRGAGINAVSYTMETSGPGVPTVEMQMWVEGNKVRVEMDEQGQHLIYLANYDTGKAYMYMPDQNMAVQIDISMAPSPEYEGIQDIPDYDYAVIGTETMDGKVCLVVEYSYGGDTVKCWIWKEHGFPIRIETTTSHGTMIAVFKNISFGDIDDGLFEVDPGVTIMEM